MVFEVIPTPGQVRAADVRLVLGDAVKSAQSIDLMVLAAEGGLPYMGPVELVWVAGGLGQHLALRCPRCGVGCKILRTDGRGAIACSPCSRTRTSRQRYRTRHAWRRLGEREVDRLLRLLRPRSGSTDGHAEQVAELVEELLAGDADRLAALTDVANAAVDVAVSVQARRQGAR